MESLPTTPSPSKGLWLTQPELAALAAAQAAACDVRAWLPPGESTEAVAVARADALQATSWRARFVALAEAVLCAEPADVRALALAIIAAAPASHDTIPVQCPDELWIDEVAAGRLHNRACAAERDGRLTVTLSNDEARAHAHTIWTLVAALRELA